MMDPPPFGGMAAAAAAHLAQRPIIAFVRDEVSEAALQSGLLGVGCQVEIRRGGLATAIRHLEKATELRAVIVDVSDSSDPVEELRRLARVCPPEVAVTAIGESRDITFYRALVHGLGVREYLPKPLTRDMVQTLLRPQLLGSAPDPESVRGGQILAVCGAQGGTGATTMAINLALQLADETHASVAILDLHLQDGESAVMLGVRPSAGLRIALADPQQADSLLLERAAIAVDTRLWLLAAEEAIDEELPLTEAGMRHVLSIMRQKFNYIVVDMPVPLPAAMRPVITLARHAFVLLEPEVTGLRNALALRHTLREIAGRDRVFTLLNRATLPGGLTLPLVEQGLGAKPDFIIPDLGKRMTEAVNLGVPALRHLPALRRHLAPMVREVAGIESRKPESWLRRLLRR